jgi:sugar-specific transcriptional regulator TrmB
MSRRNVRTALQRTAITDDLVSSLQNYGLTRLEAKVYVVLFTLGEAEASELARNLGMHFSQFYNVINSLEKKGFVEAHPGRPKRYRATDPKHIFRSRIVELEGLEKSLTERLSALKSQQEVTRKPSVWIISGVRNVLYNMERLARDAKHDVEAVLHQGFLTRNLLRLLQEKNRNGIPTYVIVYPKVPSPSQVQQLGNMDRVRLFRTFPFASLLLADCERAILSPVMPEAEPQGEFYGVSFEEQLVPSFLSESFYELWQRSDNLLPKPEPTARPGETFRSPRLALFEIQKLTASGLHVEVNVTGRDVKTHEAVEMQGEVLKVTISDLVKQFSIRLKNGKEVSVGGLYSSLEDISADEIQIRSIE